jgi:hypothetical protein
MQEVNRRPVVYIASPYTQGDVAINVRFQHSAWDRLYTLGFTPIAPLWSHYQHLFEPRPYEHWIAYDHEIIRRCVDVMIRLPAAGPNGYRQAESSGADDEVELAKSLGIPVFDSIELLRAWQRDSWKPPS